MFACKVFCFTFVLQTNDTAPDKGGSVHEGGGNQKEAPAGLSIHHYSPAKLANP